MAAAPSDRLRAFVAITVLAVASVPGTGGAKRCRSGIWHSARAVAGSSG